MSKNIFKIMGALFVLVLAVSCTVGAVSAATHTYSVDIVDNSLALTKDVPAWDAVDQSLGYFVPAESGVGAIRQAYVDGLVNSVNITYDNAEKTFSIVEINGLAADNTHSWVVKMAGNTLTSILTPVGNASTVQYLYTNTQTGVVSEEYDIIVIIIDLHTIWEGSITTTPGMTGEQALATASDNQQNFTYNVTITNAGTSYPYVWLLDVNGLSKDWYKTGYGYAISLDFEATEALNRFTVDNAYIFQISMAASSYGGIPYTTELTPYCEDEYGGYYFVESITDMLNIYL